MNSQNGWGVIAKAENRSPFPGTTVVPKPGIRDGDVATVLHYVGEQFHQRVEKLVDGWCWGYANRNVIGGSDVSNHASGTAIDLNAPNHPLGKSETYSQQQVDEIHKILAECRGVVRWGGDYTGRKDEMHFEINAGARDVAEVAMALGEGAGPAPTPVISRHYETVRNGTTYNVRAANGTHGEVIGVVKGGDTYDTIIQPNGWRQITFHGKRGYVSSQAFDGNTAAAVQQTKEYVVIPKHIKSYAAYPIEGPYSRSAGNYKELKPAKFNHDLEYEVLGYKAGGFAVVIQTQDFGLRAIWIRNTDAKIIRK